MGLDNDTQHCILCEVEGRKRAAAEAERDRLKEQLRREGVTAEEEAQEKRRYGLTCLSCGDRTLHWTSPYCWEHTEETRITLCEFCLDVFLSKALRTIRHETAMEFLWQTQEELRGRGQID